MTTRSRLAATLASASLLVLTMSGCALIGSVSAQREEPIDTGTAQPSPAPTSGDIVQPGATIAFGEWMTYEYVNHDDRRAVLQSRVTGMEPATQEQIDLLVSQLPELQGYDVSFVTLEERKVSGDDITEAADYSDYQIALTTGERGEEVLVSGWEDCPSGSFTEGFDAGSETIASCFVGAAAPGSTAVGGLRWTGSISLDDNPYSEYEGQPVFLRAN